MSRIPRSAIIPTHNRRAELYRCVEAIAPQVDHVFIIDNATDPPLGHDEADALALMRCSDPMTCVVDTRRDDEQPPNLSRLWNLGLENAEARWRSFLGVVGKPLVWDVAVLNDDAIPPAGWFDAVSKAMRAVGGVVAGSSAPFDDLPPGQARFIGGTARPSVSTRLAGWAHILRGEWDGARYDERMRWWFSDDDLSLRARQAGGLVHVGGFPVPNTGADSSTTGVLAEQAGRDRAVFVEKHGVQPW